MSKRYYGSKLAAILFLLHLAFVSALGANPGQNTGTGAQPNRVSTLVEAQVEHAREDLEKTERLVANGTLPRAKLDEAREKVADAEDEAILTRTLYAFKSAESMSKEDGEAMLAAAQRRVDRAQATVEARQRLLESGAIARVDIETAQRDLEERERSLKFAKDRIRLLQELAAMAETERELTKSAGGTRAQNMKRYDGNGVFSLGDLTPIQTQFEKKFHRVLPISALGQTLTHRALGLDHRNRVDVALSPSQPEGVWLMALLERLRVPYLAFSSAMAGAATAPHIHIGVSSTRLQADLHPRAQAIYTRPVR